jgi:DNA polymerase-3 subunit delta'
MSDAAANCLLKTLEEPPPHAVLILTAPDVGQLLPTIVSRCQVFLLRPAPLAQAEAELSERFAVAPGQASILAHLSGGRIGWAVQAVQDESILALRRQRLDALLQLAGSSRGQRLDAADALAEDYGKGQDGRDSVHETLDVWAVWWRDLLLMQEGCANQLTNADRISELEEHAAASSAADVARFLSSVIATREYLDRNVNPRLALEALLLGLPQKHVQG